MRVLITGGAGAIGSSLAEALLDRGDEVAVLDSFHAFYPRSRKERNLRQVREQKRFRGLYEGEIRDRHFVQGALAELRPDSVIHLAARAGVRPSLDEPAEYADVNVTGTAVVVTEAVSAGVERLLFASSSTVYGEQATVPFVEDLDADRPISPYGATKRAGELFCFAIARATRIPIACLRLFSVYGPRQRPDLAIARFAEQMLRGEPIEVLGDGSVERDFTYITDILEGVLAALDRAQGFRIYNLGRGRPVALNQVIATLERELGVSARRKTLPAHPADMPRTWASVERAAQELGYAPGVELEEGIRRYVAWLREAEPWSGK